MNIPEDLKLQGDRESSWLLSLSCFGLSNPTAAELERQERRALWLVRMINVGRGGHGGPQAAPLQGQSLVEQRRVCLFGGREELISLWDSLRILV